MTFRNRCGYVAILGRPNVGKSTLLNQLLGFKLSITSRKPQTTRHQILGIRTIGGDQIIFVDTPGMHLSNKRAINRYMNRAAKSAASDIDLIIFVTDRTSWTDEDELVAKSIEDAGAPAILVINKIDLIPKKNALIPHLNKLINLPGVVDTVPLSALRCENLDSLENLILKYLPNGEHCFSDDQFTDKSERFLVSEIIREKIMRQLGDEIPYSVAVEIEEFKERKRITHISALIWVERKGQKKIVIGENGEKLRTIGRDSRLDIEALLNCKVMLNLWVKVKSGWSNDERVLSSLGYN